MISRENCFTYLEELLFLRPLLPAPEELRLTDAELFLLSLLLLPFELREDDLEDPDKLFDELPPLLPLELRDDERPFELRPDLEIELLSFEFLPFELPSLLLPEALPPLLAIRLRLSGLILPKPLRVRRAGRLL